MPAGPGPPRERSDDRISEKGRIGYLSGVRTSPFDHETAFSIITRGGSRTKPTHFDPGVLQIFKDRHGEFEEIFRVHQSW